MIKLEMLILKSLYMLALSCWLLCAQDSTFSTDVRVVNLFANVHDDRGRVVRNLTQDDFALEEDGRPQMIRYFSQESDLPLTLGLLIDTSISQRRVLGEERAASYGFLSQVLRPDKDRAFVIHFDREVELLQGRTSSRQKLGDALAQLETPDRRARNDRKHGGPEIGRWALAGTALYDSLLLASDELMRKQSGRKALILLTDGVDNGSQVGLARAIETAQRADTLVYSIRFSDRQSYDGVYASMNGKRVLERISRETGGSSFEVTDAKPIATIYTQLEEELHNQYSLGYTPDVAEASPHYHHIHLSTKQTSLAVVTREGYYSGR
jgi:VWFA-related protein